VVKNVRCKLSDGKFDGNLSTIPNNNINDFILASYISSCAKISVFEPKSQHHLRVILLYFFTVKKSVVESHRLFVETYSESALRETTNVRVGMLLKNVRKKLKNARIVKIKLEVLKLKI